MADVTLISTTEGDNCITVLIGESRIEYYFNDLTAYRHFRRSIPRWLESGWTNYVVRKLTENADEIRAPNRCMPGSEKYGPPSWAPNVQVVEFNEIEQGDSDVNYQSTPSKQYSWTVIAPVAQGLCYNRGRKWFKTREDAKTFAGEIFEGERNRASFELAIVQCVDVVKPKSQVQMISTFKKSASGT